MKLTTKDHITVEEIIELYPKLGIPHFQRGLIWDKASAASLLDSLFNDIHCGTLFLWETEKPEAHGVNIDHEQNHKIEFLVIDGQQRIKNLYKIIAKNEWWDDSDEESPEQELIENDDDMDGQAFEPQKKEWVVNICKIIEDNETLKNILKNNNNYNLFDFLGIFSHKSGTKRGKHHVNYIPLSFFFKQKEIKEKDIKDYLFFNNEKDETIENTKTILETIKEIQQKILLIKKRKFFVKLESKSTYSEMINIYVKINNSGKKVEKEEIAYSELSYLDANTSSNINKIFNKAHPLEKSNELNRDFLKRLKEKNFGFKFFIKVHNLICNYHLCQTTTGYLYEKHELDTYSDYDFISRYKELRDNDKEKIWVQTATIINYIQKDILEGILQCDDLRYLHDTNSIWPIINILVRYPKLIDKKYQELISSIFLILLILDLSDDDLENSNGIGSALDYDKDFSYLWDVFNVKKNKKTLDSIEKKLNIELKSEMSIRNRYIDIYYWVLRKNKGMDFKYSSKKKNKTLKGKDLISEKMEPQKEHLVPFSHLKKNHSKKKRGKKSIFNNIGNITFISKELNILKGNSFISIEEQKKENLDSHFLLKDSIVLFDKIKRSIELEKINKKTFERDYNGFIKIRQREFAISLIGWIKELQDKYNEKPHDFFDKKIHIMLPLFVKDPTHDLFMNDTIKYFIGNNYTENCDLILKFINDNEIDIDDYKKSKDGSYYFFDLKNIKIMLNENGLCFESKDEKIINLAKEAKIEFGIFKKDYKPDNLNKFLSKIKIG